MTGSFYDLFENKLQWYFSSRLFASKVLNLRLGSPWSKKNLLVFLTLEIRCMLSDRNFIFCCYLVAENRSIVGCSNNWILLLCRGGSRTKYSSEIVAPEKFLVECHLTSFHSSFLSPRELFACLFLITHPSPSKNIFYGKRNYYLNALRRRNYNMKK